MSLDNVLPMSLEDSVAYVPERFTFRLHIEASSMYSSKSRSPGDWPIWVRICAASARCWTVWVATWRRMCHSRLERTSPLRLE